MCLGLMRRAASVRHRRWMRGLRIVVKNARRGCTTGMRRRSAAHAPHECRPPQRAEHRFAFERTLERNELVSNWIDEARRIPKRGLRRIASHAGSVGHDEPVRFEFVEHPTKQHIIEPTDATRTLAFLGPIAAEEEDRDAFDVVERLDGVVLMPGEGERRSVVSDARRELLTPRLRYSLHACALSGSALSSARASRQCG